MIRTLIVDDDFMVAAVHRGYTERVAGFEVVGVAHTGKQGLEQVRALRPDLVVLDLYLPDVSGLEVLREIRRGHPGTDVLMVTAARDAGSVLSAIQGGVVHYIVKPFDFARFQHTLEGFRRYRHQRQGAATAQALEQADVDRLFALRSGAPGDDLPKGLNRPTLELVLGHLGQQNEARSAQDVAASTGISRGTARRYLEYLERAGRAVVQPRYGTAGRPENRYRLVGQEAPRH